MFRNERHISLSAIESNVHSIRCHMPEEIQLLAVVKADGYGHGGVETARAAIAGGATFLAVAAVDEGVALRQGGITVPILCLGIASSEELPSAVENGIALTVCQSSQISALENICLALGKSVDVHMKLDTGMGRIGVRMEEEISGLLGTFAHCPHVHLTGAFTHFASSDGDDLAYTYMQLEKFRSLAAFLPEDLLLHCANSAAIHRRIFLHCKNEMARAGISMYGYPPVKTDMQLSPAMKWICQVEYVKDIAPGTSIGYGCTFTANHAMRIATITCGYGDGYLRSASGKAKVIIGGKLCPVVGRICMDQMMVDVTEVPEAKAGDAAVLMGIMGEAEITAENIAGWAGTISYEVLLSSSSRVKKIYD